MPRVLPDERRDLAKAIADFCRRECGTKEQRDKLTANGQEQHHQKLYEKMAELGWLGIAIPEECGGAGQGMTDLCLFLQKTSYGPAPTSGFGTCRSGASTPWAART